MKRFGFVLCAWLVAHAEGRPAGPAPVAAVRALLAREGARKIAGRVVRDALDPGVVQITSSGVFFGSTSASWWS